LRELNREIAEERPWESLKAGGGVAVSSKLSDWALRLCTVAHWLRPFVPSTASEIERALIEAMAIRYEAEHDRDRRRELDEAWAEAINDLYERAR